MAPESIEYSSLKAVGTVEVLHGTAVAQSAAGERALVQGDPVYQGETVVTGADSALEIRFVDDTVLSQGQDSEVNLDTFVFDPDTGAGEVFLKISHGVFRSMTGAIVDHNPDKFKIQSPLATIGIRGTTTGHFVPRGGGEENHGCLEYDGKPVVVQSNVGGPPQTLFQAGLSVGAGLAGLGAAQPYTAGQMGFFDALSPQNIGGWSAPESPFAGPGDSGQGGDDDAGAGAGSDAGTGGDGAGTGAGSDGGAGDGAGDAGVGGEAAPGAGAGPADAAASPIGGGAGEGAATPTFQLAPTSGVVGDSAGQLAGAMSMGFAAAGTDMAGESLGSLAMTGSSDSSTGQLASGFTAVTEAVAAAVQDQVGDATPDDDYTSVDPEYVAEQAAAVVSALPELPTILPEVLPPVDPSGGGSEGGGSTPSGPTSVDFLSFAGPNGVYVNLDPSSGPFGAHVPYYSYDGSTTQLADSVVNISGSGYADTIEGDERVNVIIGNCGDDSIKGYAGNDILSGANDVDTIFGGDGNDLIDGGDGNDSTLSGDSGNDVIQGGNGCDLSIMGGDGDDMLYGGDMVYTAAGDDAGDDTLYGEAGNDVLFASKGTDKFFGGADTDTLTYSYPSGDLTYPLAMNFTISSANGGTGADGTYTHTFVDIEILIGSGNNDRFYISSPTTMILDGAGGADEFKFASSANVGASIANFTSGSDKLYFCSASFTGTGLVGTTAPVSGDHVFIDTSVATNVIYYDNDWSDAAPAITVGTVTGDTVAAGDIHFY